MVMLITSMGSPSDSAKPSQASACSGSDLVNALCNLATAGVDAETTAIVLPHDKFVDLQLSLAMANDIILGGYSTSPVERDHIEGSISFRLAGFRFATFSGGAR